MLRIGIGINLLFYYFYMKRIKFKNKFSPGLNVVLG